MSISDSALSSIALSLATLSGIFLALLLAAVVFLFEQWISYERSTMERLRPSAIHLQDLQLSPVTLNLFRGMFNAELYVNSIAHIPEASAMSPFSDYEEFTTLNERIDNIFIKGPFPNVDLNHFLEDYIDASTIFMGNVLAHFRFAFLGSVGTRLIKSMPWIGGSVALYISIAILANTSFGSGLPDWVNVLVVGVFVVGPVIIGLRFLRSVFNSIGEFAFNLDVK